MMILEGFIAMVWAAAAMGVYNLGLQEANPSLAIGTVGIICKDLLGNTGRIVALLGVVILAVTSGDTAVRALRVTIAELLRIDQTSKAKRLGLSIVLFALVTVILAWAKINAQGFSILWRYFAWSNQVLSLFAFAAIAVWMVENKKSGFLWMPLLPGAFYAFVTMSYILNARIGLRLPWSVSYPVSAVFTAVYSGAIMTACKKRKDAQGLKQ